MSARDGAGMVGVVFVAGRRGDVDGKVEDRRRLEPRAADVVGVADPRDRLAADRPAIITTSTIREITRATSSIGSPRERCVSVRLRLIAMPPSWFMPASNDTRVRVDAFSNTIASVRSRSGWYSS
jgi:hypothetical protein